MRELAYCDRCEIEYFEDELLAPTRQEILWLQSIGQQPEYLCNDCAEARWESYYTTA